MYTSKTRLGAAIFAIASMAISGSAFARHNPNHLAPNPPPPVADPSPTEFELPPKVCFYTRVDFGGRYFCETGRRTVNKVKKRWRDNIKSISVHNGAYVWIYNEYNRNGEKSKITRNHRKLESDFYNHVWSYRTGAR